MNKNLASNSSFSVFSWPDGISVIRINQWIFWFRCFSKIWTKFANFFQVTPDFFNVIHFYQFIYFTHRCACTYKVELEYILRKTPTAELLSIRRWELYFNRRYKCLLISINGMYNHFSKAGIRNIFPRNT